MWTKLRAALFGESTAERHGKAAGQYASDASATAGQYASDAAATAKQYARQTADKATQTGSDLAGSAKQQAAEFAQHTQQQAQGGSTGVWASLKTMFGGQPSPAASAGDTAGQYLYKGKAAASDAAGQAADKSSDLAASAKAAAGDQAPEQPFSTQALSRPPRLRMHRSPMCPVCIEVCRGPAPVMSPAGCTPLSTFVLTQHLKPAVPCLHHSLLCFAAPAADRHFLLAACNAQPSTYTYSNMHALKTLEPSRTPQASCLHSLEHLEAPRAALSHS